MKSHRFWPCFLCQHELPCSHSHSLTSCSDSSYSSPNKSASFNPTYAITAAHGVDSIAQWGLAQSLSDSSSWFYIQVNVELLTIDKRTFTTDEGHSLQTLFGENSEGSAMYRSEVSTIAARLATVFASLKVRKPQRMFTHAQSAKTGSCCSVCLLECAHRVSYDAHCGVPKPDVYKT